ncbi:hypothetical protein T484DRAFT_2027934, partial [Baffinella frigidus]
MVARRKGGSPSSASSDPSTSSTALSSSSNASSSHASSSNASYSNASNSSNADSGSSSDAGDSDQGMVRSWSPPRLKAGRHPKTRQKKSMFKQCSSSNSSPRPGTVSPRTAAAASSQADSLVERLGTLMLLGKGKAAVTGRVKRFAMEKGRPSLLRRAKGRPPALSWTQ